MFDARRREFIALLGCAVAWPSKLQSRPYCNLTTTLSVAPRPSITVRRSLPTTSWLVSTRISFPECSKSRDAITQKSGPFPFDAKPRLPRPQGDTQRQGESIHQYLTFSGLAAHSLNAT